MARQTRPANPTPTTSGIDFLEDDDAPPAEAKVPERTPAQDAANQSAAARAIASFRVEDARRVFETAPIAPITEEDARKLQSRIYRVKREAEIRKGAASYRLPVGKVIDERQYDVAALKLQGVELEEIERT